MTIITNALAFRIGEKVVYPTYGVGEITAIEEQEVAGFKLELFVITFAKDRLTIRIPLAKAKSSGLRRLSEPTMVKEALEILSTKAKVKKGVWNRRANDFHERMGTGQLTAVAEVLRDLNRGSEEQDASYSEQQIFESALDFMTTEIAAASQVTASEARKLIEQHLAEAPHINKATVQTDTSRGPNDEAVA